MSMLVIDITPMAINRTAMYFLVRDSVKHLIARGVRLRLVAMGEPLAVSVFVASDYSLPKSFEDKVLQRFHALIEQGSGKGFSRAKVGEVYLVFDPIYIFNAAGAGHVICFVLDLTPYTRPEWHSVLVSRIYASAFGQLHDKHVDIVAISRSTARDLWANFGIPRERIRCVPLYDRLGDSQLPRNPQKVFLFVGSLEQRKNVTGLIKGFIISGLVAEGFSLHIVGGSGHGAEAIRAAADGVDGVLLSGRLSDEALLREYAQCYALVYPSCWEGFGLPVIEGLRRGIPLLLADTGALPEVAGDCAIYVDPCNLQSIAAGLKSIAASGEQQIYGADYQAAAAAQLAIYTKDNYLQQVDLLLEPWIEASLPQAGERLSSPTASSGAVNRFGRWLLLRRTQVLPVTTGEVPADSFSFDYLYGIQQERRMALSRSLSRVMAESMLRLPVNIARVLIEYLFLRITNVTVQAMINEAIALKLSVSIKEKQDG